MARGMGSTFDTVTADRQAVEYRHDQLGLCRGQEPDYFALGFLGKPYTYKVDPQPIWFHDVFHPDGTPYRQREAQILKALSGAPKGTVPASY